jgi:transcription antitermination factor NusG
MSEVVELFKGTAVAPGFGSEAVDERADLDPIDRFQGDWWVVHTKARNEKALADDLERKGIGHFLPLIHTIRRHGGRKVQVQLPLFPSYLFLCGTETDRYFTLMTHRAAGVIKVSNQEQLKRELRQIYRVTASEHPIDLYPRLRCGQRCRIIRGGLRGVEGVVVRRRDICRVYLGVEVLGQSAELEIDPSFVEAID